MNFIYFIILVMICEGKLKSGRQCQNPATWGFHKKPATRCKRHVEPRMVRRPFNLKNCSVCNKTATYRSVPYTYRFCEKHYIANRKKEIYKANTISSRYQTSKYIKYVEHYSTYCELCCELATNTDSKDNEFPVFCVKHANPDDTKYVAKWKKCVKCFRFTPFGNLCTEHRYTCTGTYEYNPEDFVRRECKIEHDCPNFATHSYKDDPAPFACRLHAASDMVVNSSGDCDKCIKCNKKKSEYTYDDRLLPIYCADCCPTGVLSTKAVYTVCNVKGCKNPGYYDYKQKGRVCCGLHLTSDDTKLSEVDVNICPDCATLISADSTHCAKHFISSN